MTKLKLVQKLLLLSLTLFSVSCTVNGNSTSTDLSSVTTTPTTTTPTTPTTPTDPVVTTPSYYKMYIHHETGGVYSVRYNYTSGTIDQTQSIDLATVLGAPIANSTNRGLFSNIAGDLVSLHHNTLNVGVLTSSLAAQSPAQVLFTAGGLSGFYGGCQLPNGNYILGADQWGGQKANEYTKLGVLVRTFNSTQQYTFSSCSAISNTRVAWIDYDANTDQNGDVVISEFASGSWSEVGRYATNTQLAGLSDSMWYSVVAHTNGYIYAFPFAGGGARNKKVLKCSATGTMSDCALVGADLTTVNASIDTIQGAAQLTSRDEIAFVASNRYLYLFDPVTNVTTQKLDLSATLPSPGCCELRSFVVVGQ